MSFLLPNKTLFVGDILEPLEKELAIRYIEFPGETCPIVFVRLAAISQIDADPVFGCLTARIESGMATSPWSFGHVCYPIPNWEIAARLLCEGRIWESALRSWEAAEYKKPDGREWLVQSLGADKPFVANPTKPSELPEFAPIDPVDKVYLQKLVALQHMIPCYLDTGLFHGSEHQMRRKLITKLQERLAGYIRSVN